MNLEKENNKYDECVISFNVYALRHWPWNYVDWMFMLLHCFCSSKF